MHEHGGYLLTAGKDSRVSVSRLETAAVMRQSGGGSGGGAGLATAVQCYEDLHDGVVKCARWREGSGSSSGGAADPVCFASCGNDRRLCVVDTRQPTSAGE